jgi:hypothetical protein
MIALLASHMLIFTAGVIAGATMVAILVKEI